MLVKIQEDVKTAMLAGDKFVVGVLRGLVSVIKTAQIDHKKELSDAEIVKLFQKESKRRTEAAEMYEKGGASDRAEEELREKKLIEDYLPEQMSEEQIAQVVDRVIEQQGASSMAEMGKVIGQVKQETGGQADGATIARLVKGKLSQ